VPDVALKVVPVPTDVTLAEACANGDVSAATSIGAALPADKLMRVAKATITAQDVTSSTPEDAIIPVCAINKTTAPTHWLAQRVDTSGVEQVSANLEFSWVQVNTNNYMLQVKETQAAATDLVAGDVITVLIFE